MIEIDEEWFLRTYGIINGKMREDHEIILEQLYAQMMGWA